jgi:DNA-binding transcriptional LysR family regulator
MNAHITNSEHRPDLRLLTTFATVASIGSMTAAADLLGYVPSNVSQQVSILEKSLGGVELFTRSPGRRLTITPAGRFLANAVDELLIAAASFQDVATAVSNGDGIQLRIGAYGTAMSHLLPAALTQVIEPNYRSLIHMVEVETRDGLQLLERGELDLLVATRYVDEDPPYYSDKLKMTNLGREELLLVAPLDQNGITTTLAECKDRDWVAGATTDVDRKLIRQWATQIGFEPRIQYETSNFQVAMGLISNRLAVGLIPASVINAASENMRLSVVDFPTTIVPPRREVIAVTRARFHMAIVDKILSLLANVPFLL